ncbi:hypothetical protein VKT23_020791 [Stygiomarasmius scandens]|uniref:Uncharacterized protein n=1 Tax=Marasmiellus scandens TaxID=2682957 RepID=A0ABR1J656_9AGAR
MSGFNPDGSAAAGPFETAHPTIAGGEVPGVQHSFDIPSPHSAEHVQFRRPRQGTPFLYSTPKQRTTYTEASLGSAFQTSVSRDRPLPPVPPVAATATPLQVPTPMLAPRDNPTPRMAHHQLPVDSPAASVTDNSQLVFLKHYLLGEQFRAHSAPAPTDFLRDVGDQFFLGTRAPINGAPHFPVFSHQNTQTSPLPPVPGPTSSAYASRAFSPASVGHGTTPIGPVNYQPIHTPLRPQLYAPVPTLPVTAQIPDHFYYPLPAVDNTSFQTQVTVAKTFTHLNGSENILDWDNQISGVVSSLGLTGHICGPTPPNEPATLLNTLYFPPPPLTHMSTPRDYDEHQRWSANDNAVCTLLLLRVLESVRSCLPKYVKNGNRTTAREFYEEMHCIWGLRNEARAAVAERKLFSSKASSLCDVTEYVSTYRIQVNMLDLWLPFLDWSRVIHHFGEGLPSDLNLVDLRNDAEHIANMGVSHCQRSDFEDILSRVSDWVISRLASSPLSSSENRTKKGRHFHRASDKDCPDCLRCSGRAPHRTVLLLRQ